MFNKNYKQEQDNLMKYIRGLVQHYSLYVGGDKKITKITKIKESVLGVIE
jgi:DNA phosphorothioation-dependent restriction protein DptH